MLSISKTIACIKVILTLLVKLSYLLLFAHSLLLYLLITTVVAPCHYYIIFVVYLYLFLLLVLDLHLYSCCSLPFLHNSIVVVIPDYFLVFQRHYLYHLDCQFTVLPSLLICICNWFLSLKEKEINKFGLKIIFLSL